MPMSRGKVPALTSDPACPAILFPEAFGPERGCLLGYSLGNRFLHSPVTMRTRRYCFLGYSDLGEVISYTLAMPIFWGKITPLTSDPRSPASLYPTILFPGLFGPGRAC